MRTATDDPDVLADMWLRTVEVQWDRTLAVLKMKTGLTVLAGGAATRFVGLHLMPEQARFEPPGILLSILTGIVMMVGLLVVAWGVLDVVLAVTRRIVARVLLRRLRAGDPEVYGRVERVVRLRVENQVSARGRPMAAQAG